MKNYSVKEIADKFNISKRRVQRLCEKYKVAKKGNEYLIPEEVVRSWVKQTTLVTTNDTCSDIQLGVDIESLKKDNEKLKIIISELQKELIQYDIEENERIEVFTNEQYSLFEQRLQEWRTQRIEIEHQEQLFKAEKKSISELYDHYKNQFEYQKKQNDKFLDMHQKLLDVISSQAKSIQERNLIEAVEKDIIDKNRH